MLKPMKAVLAVLLIAFVCSVLLQNHRPTVLKSAGAIESSSAQTGSVATEEQLLELLLERRNLLDSIVDNINSRRETGLWNLRDYFLAKKAAFLAGVDLSETKEERIGIRKGIVLLHDVMDRHIQLEVSTGQIGRRGLAEARVARLESEIDLLREQLN